LNTEPQRANELLENAENLSHHALTDVRESVYALREDVIGNQPIADLLESAFKPASQANIDVDFRVIGTPYALPAAHILALLRAAQESVSNTIKHAKATSINSSINYNNPQQIVFIYQDDGVGSPQMEGGFGLVGMQERVNILEGDIQIKTSPGQGFRVEIRLPEKRDD